MHCQVTATPEGRVMFVCGPRGRHRPPPCHHCGEPSSRLCDKTVSREPFQTCDRPLCAACAQHRPGGIDYCREHAL
jgi:hypothetical protein